MNDMFKNFSLMAGGSHYPTINPALQQQFGEAIVKHILDKIEKEIDQAYRQEEHYAMSTLQALAMEILDDFDMKAVQ